MQPSLTGGECGKLAGTIDRYINIVPGKIEFAEQPRASDCRRVHNRQPGYTDGQVRVRCVPTIRCPANGHSHDIPLGRNDGQNPKGKGKTTQGIKALVNLTPVRDAVAIRVDGVDIRAYNHLSEVAQTIAVSICRVLELEQPWYRDRDPTTRRLSVGCADQTRDGIKYPNGKIDIRRKEQIKLLATLEIAPDLSIPVSSQVETLTWEAVHRRGQSGARRKNRHHRIGEN
ncbi:MAG: hypothetical protein AW10_00141 [Candidatus Accumulibacter appositus]|uniref:Uncharacterized protein n=1 Tax=Candidatus Accumulibacter appositus TaxID=1454003 RepID=A0A011Q132_9PROT|nr:MAG: hypothetical protein AW10_00141 [Candidatus Accumulibacter appositus]